MGEPAASTRRSRCLGIREHQTHVAIHKLKLNQPNGLMETSALFEPPFTDAHDQGIVGVLPEDAPRIVKVIERVNANADVA